MTDDIEGVISSVSISQILVAILETVGEVRVPTLTFLDASSTDKELVIEYDEDGPSFTFKLKEKEQDGTSD